MTILNWLKSLFKSEKAQTSNEFYCGCYPDCYDDRDYIKEIERGVEPRSISLLPKKFIVSNQGRTNACTGHAMAAFLSILYSKLDSRSTLQFNHYYIYYWSRMLAFGEAKTDKGSFLRETIKAVAQYGALTTKQCKLKSVYDKPVNNGAHPLTIRSYFRLPRHDLVNAMLYTLIEEKLPIFLSVHFKPKCWQSAKTTGILTDNPNESSQGCHAICIYGYDNGYFLAVNSWGTGFGNNGLFKIATDVITPCVADAWTVGYNYF